MNDSYLYIIVALLPLSAFMLTIQANPYNALVVRGILGGVAALVYAVLGAADVALTEALVGTMLAITLYAVAVRSSMVMRLGVLNDSLLDADEKSTGICPFAQLIADLRTIANRYHLRLELVPYPDLPSLHQALVEKEVHATCIQRSHPDAQEMILPKTEPKQAGLSAYQMLTTQELATQKTESKPYYTTIRIRRLYEILLAELASPATNLIYVTVSDGMASSPGEKHSFHREKH